MRVSGLFTSAKEGWKIEEVKKDSARENDCSCRPVGCREVVAYQSSAVGSNDGTGSISRKIDRGKHTTRHSELLVLEEDERWKTADFIYCRYSGI